LSVRIDGAVSTESMPGRVARRVLRYSNMWCESRNTALANRLVRPVVAAA